MSSTNCNHVIITLKQICKLTPQKIANLRVRILTKNAHCMQIIFFKNKNLLDEKCQKRKFARQIVSKKTNENFFMILQVFRTIVCCKIFFLLRGLQEFFSKSFSPHSPPSPQLVPPPGNPQNPKNQWSSRWPSFRKVSTGPCPAHQPRLQYLQDFRFVDLFHKTMMAFENIKTICID